MKKLKKIQKALLPKKEDPVALYAIKALIKRYREDDLAGIGGQLSYFFIMSLFPFLMLVNHVITLLKIDSQAMTAYLGKIMPENMIKILDNYLEYLSGTENSGFLTFGILVTVLIASKAITVLFGALNKAFRSEEEPGFLKTIMSYLLVIFILVLIAVSVLFLSVGSSLFAKILAFFSLPEELRLIWDVIRWLVPIGGMIIVNTVLYYIISDRNFPKRYVFVGATFSTFLWILMGIGLSYYTANFGNYSVVYGALGAMMVMLIFLYWSGIVIVLGGELAHILGMRAKGNYSFDVED